MRLCAFVLSIIMSLAVSVDRINADPNQNRHIVGRNHLEVETWFEEIIPGRILYSCKVVNKDKSDDIYVRSKFFAMLDSQARAFTLAPGEARTIEFEGDLQADGIPIRTMVPFVFFEKWEEKYARQVFEANPRDAFTENGHWYVRQADPGGCWLPEAHSRKMREATDRETSAD